MLKKLEGLGVIERDADATIWFRYTTATVSAVSNDGRSIGGTSFWNLALIQAPNLAYVDLGVLGTAELTHASQATPLIELMTESQYVILDCRRVERVTAAFASALVKDVFRYYEPINASPRVAAILLAALRRKGWELKRVLQREEELMRY